MRRGRNGKWAFRHFWGVDDHHFALFGFPTNSAPLMFQCAGFRALRPITELAQNQRTHTQWIAHSRSGFGAGPWPQPKTRLEHGAGALHPLGGCFVEASAPSGDMIHSAIRRGTEKIDPGSIKFAAARALRGWGDHWELMQRSESSAVITAWQSSLWSVAITSTLAMCVSMC